MKLIHPLLVLMLALVAANSPLSAQNASFVVNGAAAKIVATGTAFIVLNNANYKNNASATHFSGAASTVKFTGSGPVAVVSSSSGFATAFGNVQLSRVNGLTLTTPVSAISTLTMNAGNIMTTASSLLTVGASPASPGSVAWTAGTVVGPMKRFYSPTASATAASGIFPVGNALINRWAQVNFGANMATAGFITVEYKSGVCPIAYNGLPATINGLLINNYENEGYWTITPTGGDLNTTAYTLMLRGNQLTSVYDITKLRVIKSAGHTAWNDNPAGDGNHVSAVGTTSDFTIGSSAMNGFSWFNIGSDATNSLPVALTHFSASCAGENVQVNWSTASETNSQQFIVEKSRDLVTWSVAGQQDAAGSSNAMLNYQFTDNQPFSGNSYYRLIQTDNNGDQKAYDPVSVSCTGAANDIFVFPNPAQQDFTLSVSSTSSIAQAQIELSDITGKIISVRTVSIQEGNNHFPFTSAELAYGTYMLRVLTEGDEFKPVKVVINY